jgi:serine/threonine protein kinase
MGCAGGSSAVQDSFYDKYAVGDKLAEGTFGQVFAVSPKRPVDRELVVKIVTEPEDEGKLPRKASTRTVPASRSSRSQDSQTIQRHSLVEDTITLTKNEIQLMKRAEGTRHCVQLYESFVEGLQCFLVMEKCRASLMDLRNEFRLWSESQQSCLFKDVLFGLAHIHQKSVIHRDINPKNILLAQDGKAKICDFGWATEFLSTGLHKQRVGTLQYMSPEMLGDYGYAQETDIWSLGVSAYVLLYGELPYRPPSPTVKALLDEILDGNGPAFVQAPQHEGGTTPSSSMTNFVRKLMDTSRFSRCTSWKALQDPLIRRYVLSRSRICHNLGAGASSRTFLPH